MTRLLDISNNTHTHVSGKTKWLGWISESSLIRNRNHLRKQTLNYLAKLAQWLGWVVSTYLYGAFDCILLSCHVCVSEIIYTLLRRDIWSLTDRNGIQTHNHLIRKRTLNHLANLTKWLSYVVSTYLYGAFDCMSLSCHLRILEWIYTQGVPFHSGNQHVTNKFCITDIVNLVSISWF